MSNVVSLASAKAPAPQAAASATAASAPAVTAAFKTTGWAGKSDGRVSSEWFRRPADQKFTSLYELHDAALAEAEVSEARTVDTRKIEVIADAANGEALHFAYTDENGSKVIARPTHYSFGQACALVKAPASYLRRLPGKLAGVNLQYGLAANRAELVKVYTNGVTQELKAITGPDYGRVFDHELAAAVMKFAGNGTGDTRWKVPGMLGAGGYNPFVDITKDTTTLYASDRDCFLFLVDDTHPIEIGKLANGEPDLVFRGFYAWNSEVGDKSLGFATMLMRGVCANRILWGVQDVERLVLRHSKLAPSRFVEEIAPALEAYAEGSDENVRAGILAARAAIVAQTKEARYDFLKGLGFAKNASDAIIKAVFDEEGREPDSVWDFVQGITATARSIEHADARVAVERIAGKLMTKVAKAA